MQINHTKTVATNFRGHAKFGRTTTLIEKSTGRKLIEVMGAVSRKDAFAAFVHQQAK